MNVFVIHKSDDKDLVSNLIDEVNSKESAANFLILKDGTNN